MTRHLVLGILIGFGVAVLFLAAFGAQGVLAPEAPKVASAPATAPRTDGGPPCANCGERDLHVRPPARNLAPSGLRPLSFIRAGDAGL